MADESVAKLAQEIEAHWENCAENSPLSDYCKGQDINATGSNMKMRRILKGHFGKIYAMHWSTDHKHLVSASQDGKLIIWNAFSTNKVHAIPLKSSWVMTCAYSNDGTKVACGGLDNQCSLYSVPRADSPDTAASSDPLKPVLAQHEGYLSCCRFTNNDDHIITSSGDSTCILWDLKKGMPITTFNDHSSDVMSVSIFADGNTSQFVSGSCDAKAKLWDYRVDKPNVGEACVGTYAGHESDINSVAFFPGGTAFGTGSDDSSCRLFDIRTYRQLNKFAQSNVLCGITSIAFSQTGNWLFGGYDDFAFYVWDTLTAQLVQKNQGHDNRVSCLGVSAKGGALCTGSWDTLLKVWA